MSEWRPIATAPKDRALLLALRKGMVVGLWDKVENAWRLSSRSVLAVSRLEGDRAPTHWMPLPPHPETPNLQEHRAHPGGGGASWFRAELACDNRAKRK